MNKSNLNESGLSRVWKHNTEHECGALTAYRKGEDCGKGDEFTKADNQKRNKSLLSKLMSKGYGVTSLKGKYPEGGKSQTETSFFVVNLNDDNDFFKTLKELGEQFDQDSILLIPKGAVNGDSKAYLVGTNKCENNWLGYGKRELFKGGAKFGVNSSIYTSMVNGRPFIFENVDKEHSNPASGMGIWSMLLQATKNWKDLDY